MIQTNFCIIFTNLTESFMETFIDMLDKENIISSEYINFKIRQ